MIRQGADRTFVDVQGALRPDLRLLVMSATLDGARIAQWLDAPRLSSAGRSFPVDVSHAPPKRDEALEHQVRRVLVDALATQPGDLITQWADLSRQALAYVATTDDQ